MASRAATVVRVGEDGVQLRFTAPCTGCSGCSGRCRAFRLYEPAEQTLTLPRHLFRDTVGPGEHVELSIGDRDLRRLAGRMYAGALVGLITGAATAAAIAALTGIPVDPSVLAGALLGSAAGWRVVRPEVDMSLIEIHASS